MFQKYFNSFGRRAAVWDATDGWASKEEAYWGSMPVEVHNSGAAHYQQQDWLGTERMVTGYTGSVEGTYDSLPFGDGFQVTGSDPDQYHFAGLDYEYKVGTNGGALARYRMYYNTTGSWMSPDPSGVSYDFTNPQSFNRYSYTLNNPVSLTDPTGQFTCPACTAPIGIACPWCAVGAAVGGLIYDLGKVFCWWGCHHPAFHGSLKPRPNAQPWDEYHIHWWNGANLATALGLPDESCDFGVCNGIPALDLTPGAAVDATGPIIVPSQWVFYILGLAHIGEGAAGSGGVPYPKRLFGTHWCGPGGAGPPVNGLDVACKAHDGCYGSGGFTPWSDWNVSLFNQPGRVQALQRCNQALCNAARQTGDAGSTRVGLYFESVPVGSCQ